MSVSASQNTVLVSEDKCAYPRAWGDPRQKRQQFSNQNDARSQDTYQDIEDSRSHIAKRTLLLLAVLLVLGERKLFRVTSHDKRHRVGGVCGVRRAGLGVEHLLGVAMVGRDEQDVARLLARLVDGADGLVGVRDGLDRGLINTGVANLRLRHSGDPKTVWQHPPYPEERSYT